MNSMRLDESKKHDQRLPVIALVLPLLLSLGAPIALVPRAEVQESNGIMPKDI